jgi:hypothetical protein
MPGAETSGNDERSREIRLIENPDGQWTARDLQLEVSAQGETGTAALDNLNAVVRAIVSEEGHEPTDEELRELGVDPETARTQDNDLPNVLR